MKNLDQTVGEFLAGEKSFHELQEAYQIYIQGYRLVDDHAEIPLTKDQWAKVDIDDLPRVLPYSWFCVGDGSSDDPFYARAKINGKSIPLARHLLGLKDRNIIGDHINRDTLNNRQENLRPVSKQQSAQNRGGWKRKNSTSGSSFKGVYKSGTRWRVVIKDQGKPIHVGYFPNEIEAAKAYDLAAEKYHGRYAARNFPAPA